MKMLAQQHRSQAEEKRKKAIMEKEMALQKERAEVDRTMRNFQKQDFSQAKQKSSLADDLKSDWKVRMQKRQVGATCLLLDSSTGLSRRKRKMTTLR